METYDWLFARCIADGILVCRGELDGALGLWDEDTRAVWIDERLNDWHAGPVLAHELRHADHHDSGPCHLERETFINMAVAKDFIDIRDYIQAERTVGADPRLIAAELDQLPWLVTAYQQLLERRRIPERGETIRALRDRPGHLDARDVWAS